MYTLTEVLQALDFVREPIASQLNRGIEASGNLFAIPHN